jgi:CubicO group peptidase (beta-lactamase class C family)
VRLKNKGRTMQSVLRARNLRGGLSVAFILWVCVVGLPLASARETSADAEPIRAALEQLTAEKKFSGAVVVQGAEGVRFAKGYGWADPFTSRAFTPDTPVDSASLAKPVTAAVVLLLAREGKIDLDQPVRRYLPRYPHEATTVRHLLAHSAGLPPEEQLEPLAGKTNEMIMLEIAERDLPPMFAPGEGFNYCNFCYSTLALLLERVSGASYLRLARDRAALAEGVTIRPLRLADWRDRAIGYRRTPEGEIERADSYESEAFYGTANLSISASQLAEWGAQWWQAPLASIRAHALTPARIAGKPSGLTWGNWYCAASGERCHYLGHHEGFHHMLYWDARRRLAVAMVTNNTLSPGLQQRLQRALIAFAEGRSAQGFEELRSELPDNPVQSGDYVLSGGETIALSSEENRVSVTRGGLRYRAYRIGAGIRYVPGLDTYLAGSADGRLHWLNLYEDIRARPQ